MDKILVIDDDQSILQMIKMRMESEDYQVSTAMNYENALTKVKDDAFDLALCSHLLFLYSEHLSVEFHIASMLELCRIAPEVRVFPLMELNAQKSRHVDNVVASFERNQIEWKIEQVPYEFQKGGCEMLRCNRRPAP